jgi:hypothetical protein
MNSIVNYNREENEKIKIKNLPLYAKDVIFDFTYPLSSNINRDEFEVMILKKFMMYRIGYDTLNAFKIALDVKLNEIMPIYNKMFDMLEGWDLFSDGERETRNVTDSRTTNSTNTTSGTNTSSNTSDRRFSQLPQNQLDDLRNGTFVTDYNYDTTNGTDTVSSSGSNNILDNGTLQETITRSPADKIKIYKEFIENRDSIYTMIFKDLSVLFYGLA